MIGSEIYTFVLSVTTGMVAFMMLYDARRALRPQIEGEKAWRAWRVLGTTVAIGALAVLQRSQVVWLKGVAAVTLLIAVGFVLRCSMPLKRLVETSLLYRRERR